MNESENNWSDFLTQRLSRDKESWLVTGAAGFIGSHLVDLLIRHQQDVVGIDNFSTSSKANLDLIQRDWNAHQKKHFKFVEGDITNLQCCTDAVRGIDYVLHQAAVGSVPRSVREPLRSFSSNVDGFFKLAIAAKTAGVRRFVYASSSSVYGDHPALPKTEANTGLPLSPYAATKVSNELFADVIARTYSMSAVGTRYFNIFGPRQNPEGDYAAVIPRWIHALATLSEVRIFGDGETSRDFCFIANAVQANLRAALAPELPGAHQVINVAAGGRTSLNELFELIKQRVVEHVPEAGNIRPIYGDFREADVRHSHADVSRAKQMISYEPTHDIAAGLDVTINWYLDQLNLRRG